MHKFEQASQEFTKRVNEASGSVPDSVWNEHQEEGGWVGDLLQSKSKMQQGAFAIESVTRKTHQQQQDGGGAESERDIQAELATEALKMDRIQVRKCSSFFFSPFCLHLPQFMTDMCSLARSLSTNDNHCHCNNDNVAANDW